MIESKGILTRANITERGWGGHFICAHRCLFRRNTLVEYEAIKIVVSTVGLMQDYHAPGFPNKLSFERVGHDRYYETMAFHSDPTDTRYHDIDASRQVHFKSPWSIDHMDADDEANEMHESVVREMATRLLRGETFDDES